METWVLILAIITLALGLAGLGVIIRVLWLFCQGNGEIDRRPWED